MQDKKILYEKNSLASQIANLSLQIAEKDALIFEQQEELEELREQQIKEMDEDAEQPKKK